MGAHLLAGVVGQPLMLLFPIHSSIKGSITTLAVQVELELSREQLPNFRGSCDF